MVNKKRTTPLQKGDKGDDSREGEEEDEAGEDDGAEEEVTRHVISKQGGGLDKGRKVRG